MPSRIRHGQTRVADDSDTSFARLVSLACHDVRTPLATVHGFAKTLARTVDLRAAGRPLRRDDRGGVGADGRAARRALARRADRVAAATTRGCVRRTRSSWRRLRRSGSARSACTSPARARRSRRTSTRVDRGVSALVQSALRHGGLDEVEVVVRGAEIDVSPVTDSSAPVVLGDDLRDLGAAVAVRLVEAARRLGRRRGRDARRSGSPESHESVIVASRGSCDTAAGRPWLIPKSVLPSARDQTCVSIVPCGGLAPAGPLHPVQTKFPWRTIR